MIGMPLLDFLTEISASANAHAAEAYVQEPMLPSVSRTFTYFGGLR